MIPNPRPALDLDGLLGAPEHAVRERLGAPRAVRSVGGERWLLYEDADASVRVRLRPVAAGPSVVRSWTVTFGRERDSLRSACAAVGVAPEEPDALDEAMPAVPPGAHPLIRRRLADDSSARVHSLTARVGAGGILALTAFDEPPDWRARGAPS